MSPVGERLQRWFGAASLLLVCFSIAFAPFPFGSVGIGAITLLVMVLGLAAILAATQPAGVSQSRLLFGWAGLLCCWSSVIALQIFSVPWLGGALDDPIWKETSRLLGVDIPGSPSALRMQPILAAGPSLIAFLASACGIMLGSSVRQGKLILKAFAWSGLAYAVFAIAAHTVDPTKILGYSKQQYIGELTGTFYNRNTAAIFFGCCGAAWLALMLEQIRRRVGSALDWATLRLIFRRRLALFHAAAIVLCLVAMFMTRSRAGSVTALIGWLAVGCCYYYRTFRSPRAVLSAVCGAVFGGAIVIQFLGGGLVERLGVEGVSDEGRWYAYRSTWQMIASSPWLGKGLGSFAWTFPAYRSPEVSSWGVWDRAHNTLLEIAAESGVPMALLIVAVWILLSVLLLRQIGRRTGDLATRSAALGTFVAGSLHSLVDFSLQIPAFSLVFFILLGVGLARPRMRSEASLSTLEK